jgi:hypothetical protein
MTLKSRVSPFGNLRIKTCSQFPEAYRNVLRPSSPLNAKASTKRSYYTLLNSQTFFIHFKIYIKNDCGCLSKVNKQHIDNLEYDT